VGVAEMREKRYNNSGKVTVSLRTEGEGKELRVAVTDTGLLLWFGFFFFALKSVVEGPGVSAVFEGLLFKEYARDSSTATTQSGAGLGLSISKRLVHGMGGKIGYAREPTTFWFSVPLQAEKRSEGEEEKKVKEEEKEEEEEEEGEEKSSDEQTSVIASRLALGGGGGGRRRDEVGEILLVEDNAVNARVMQSMLSKLAPKSVVQMVCDGAAALEVLLRRVREQAGPLLVLMDRNMPLVNG